MSLSILEALSGSKVKSQLLYWLYAMAADDEKYTEKELATKTKVPTGSIHKALMQLSENELIVREETKLGPVYRAPHEDPRLKPLFLLLRQDSAIVAQLRRALKPFRSVDYACVFGSFARGQTHRKSDIDVLVLQKNADEQLEIMTALSHASDKLSREVNAQYYATTEFKSLIERGEPIAMSILANTRIDLKGELPWH